jgi:hippurate hydrolase
MMRYSLPLLVALGLLSTLRSHTEEPKNPVKSRSEKIDALLKEELPKLDELYRHLHANPELSLKEEKTAARLVKEMESLGFEVTPKVGGTGVVAILKNGAGPTILVRTDMDALPVTEQTGLPYASKVTTRDKNGREVGVMHACGHDMHMTCWVGTARTLVAMKDQWKGTLMFIAQPAEEIGAGARLMLADGLFKRFPKPDFGLALHCDSLLEAGQIHYTEGLAMANVDTVDLVIKGKGGHGASPHTTVDPVVLSARIILDLQTIVSREIAPSEPAVVTVGSIHGGSKHNIIPNEVRLQLTVRSTKDSTRKHILDAIQRLAKSAAEGARAPEPEMTVHLDEFTPALYNDPKLTRKTVSLFKEILGEDKVKERPTQMGGEDFSRYALNGEIPICMFYLGTISPERMAESRKEGGKPLPSMHADSYFPAIEPSIKTGVKTMSLAILQLNGK